MAEVLPPLQSSGSISMLHSRPSSADAFQTSPQPYPQSPRLGQPTRSMYNNGQNTGTGYRGVSAAPVQPYAFQATPTLRQDPRGASAPTSSPGVIGNRHGHTQSVSASSTNSSDTSSAPSGKDDSVMGSRNGSLINLSSAVPDLSLTNFDSPVKPPPDRYRRPGQKRMGSENAQPGKATTVPVAPSSGVPSQLVQRQGSVDDLDVPKSTLAESAKRYRRRSLNTLDTRNIQATPGAPRPSSGHGPSATSTPTTIRPVSFHERSGSDDSQSSQRKAATSNDANPSRAESKGIVVPPRGSSDAVKRMTTPSPLSRQAVDVDASSTSPTMTKLSAPSAAAQHLAAVSDRDLNKGMKSRLRRAFSFGSAQELRRAAGEHDAAAAHTQQTQQQHQQAIDDGMDAEQMEIARRQEAAGFGAGIYNGQGGVTGSTDNISISSTASSASMMLRKMGRGAKKSARSIKGLFRPKSVIGVPAADGPIQASAPIVQPSVAQVSMVTVEAERLKVNVSAGAGETPQGITGFPKLERNSIDTANLGALPPPSRGSADGSDAPSRRSVVGSDKDRAEVLAAVKKGILKRSGTSSPTTGGSPIIHPNETRAESPVPSMPSTPKDGRSSSMNSGHGTSGSMSGDYFGPRSLPLPHASRSMPCTPNGGGPRNISFSPRIQFHDAWSSTEYDRRGDVATCNRLTPMLAQQIKEELNTFKMEMEVHELSKPHTHFF